MRDNSHGVFTHCHPCAGTVLPQTCATAYAPMLPPSACLSLYLLPLDRGLEMMTTTFKCAEAQSKFSSFIQVKSAEHFRLVYNTDFLVVLVQKIGLSDV